MPKDRITTLPRQGIKKGLEDRGDTRQRSGGRPSREAAALLGDKILDTATELFLRDGYGSVSIEMIARGAGVSKRTFYQRFSDKAGVFMRVVHRIMDQLRPENDASLFEGDDLETVLKRVGGIILDAALTPNALALYRITIAEGARFPDLAKVIAKESAGPEAIRRLGELLEREAMAGRRAIKNNGFVSAQFLYMIISVPQRRAMGTGKPMTKSERAEWVSSTVDLLLNGCRAAA